MAEGDDTFSVDIEALEAGGVHLKDLSELTGNIYGGLRSVLDQYGDDLGGNGQIGDTFKQYYLAPAHATESFIQGLQDLTDVHGSTIAGLGVHFGGLNDDTKGIAGGSGRGKH